MKKIFYILSAVLFTVFSFYSCETPVALGTRLNLDPPVITIETPDFMQNVSGSLHISGSVEDNVEVVYIRISVERISLKGDSWKQEWEGNRGVWRNRALNSQWSAAQDAVWKASGKSFVDWSVSVSMEGAPNGEYLITVGAENNSRIEGVLGQRRVIIDKDPPVVSVLIPSTDEEEPVGKYSLRNPADLDKLKNQNIRVQYEITDEFSINGLTFMLIDDTDVIYCEKKIDYPSWSGRLEILSEEIKDEDGNVITSDRYNMQLVSIATDKAGNEKLCNHGWIVYWPESDIPWVTGAGHSSDPAQSKVFPESDIQVLVYDDDGVQWVSYNVFIVSGGQPEGYTDVPIIVNNNPIIEGASPSAFFSFSIKVPLFCNNYRIEFNVRDINNADSDPDYSTFYFHVMDNSAPNVEINTPPRNETLFGDNAGKFTISGNASGGAEPSSLKLVWIKPGNIDDQFEYQIAESTLWNNAASNGNKIWDLTGKMGTSKFDNVTARFARDFEIDLNLFSDLGIDIDKSIPSKSLLTAQTFIFRVSVPSGSAVTVLHNVRGDITPPEITIDKIIIYRDNTLIATYLTKDNPTMMALKANDEVFLEGTWKDDSYDVWGNVNKMSGIEIKWNDLNTTLPANMLKNKTWSTYSNTNQYPLILGEEDETKGGGRIEASISDIGGNKGSTHYSAKVDTKIPVLMYIKSLSDIANDTSFKNGSYKAGTEIPIILEFNKPVIYKSGTASIPLNSGGTAVAVYDTTSGNGTSQRFIYTVGTNDSTENKPNKLLNVESTAELANLWKDESGMSPVITLPKSNLSSNNEIIIDTAKPYIKSVSSMTSDGYYRAEQEIFLRVEFSEEIVFTEGLNNETKLNLTLTSGTGAGEKPVRLGNNILLFTYTIATGHNSNKLDADISSVLSFTSGSIEDLAGNDLDITQTFTNISDGEAGYNNIVIDTISPAAPGIVLANRNNNNSLPQEYTISNIETGAYVQYRVDFFDNDTWTLGNWRDDYNPTPVPAISSSGTYRITARQTDLAKNQTTGTTSSSFTIARDLPLLERLGGSAPGTYGKSPTIPTTNNPIRITVKLREAVSVTTPTSNFYLVLNVPRSGGTFARANYTSGGGSDTLTFTYTVLEGDDTPQGECLEITELVSGGSLSTDIQTELGADILKDNYKLSNYTRITISTTPPVYKDAVINAAGDKITLNFLNKDIFKGTTGNITFTQLDTFLPPAVLTKDEYNSILGKLSSASAAAIKDNYKEGTNGADKDGNPFLTEKYILNYDIDTNDTDNQKNKDIVTALKAAGADKLVVGVNTGDVAVGTDKRSLVITLGGSSGFKFNVKGVSYAITFPAGLVQDTVGNKVAALNGTSTVANPGINEPFIRIHKEKEDIVGSGTVPTVNATFTETTTIEGGKWVKNSAFILSTGTPAAPNGETWEKVDVFTMSFLNNPANPVSRIYTSGGTNRIHLEEIKRNGGEVNGTLFQDKNNTSFYHFSHYPGSHGVPGHDWNRLYNHNHNATEHAVNDQCTNGGDGCINTAYVNPYENEIIYSSQNQEGDIRINNLWVDTKTGTVQETEPANKTGWLQISGKPVTNSTFTVEKGTDANVTQLTAKQRLKANVKIDCQTPGVTIRYAYNEKGTEPFAGPFIMGNHTKPSVSMPTENEVINATGSTNPKGGSYSTPFEIGTEDNLSGYLYAISARASKTNAGVTSTSTAFEKASRSVVMFNGVDSAKHWNANNSTGNRMQLWLRGGDGLSGENLTKGFPLSWNVKKPEGIRLMTNTAATGTWYWVSWEVNKTAYFHFIRGTTPTAASGIADIKANGPLGYAWSKNSWSFQQREFPLYPGGSLIFRVATSVSDPATEVFEFYEALQPR